MYIRVLAVFIFIPPISIASQSVVDVPAQHRSRRELLFPNSTLLQLNIGVGTPSPVKDVNINWAIQANFQLPWNRSQIPGDILTANTGYVGFSKRKRDVNPYSGYVNDAKLYHFYQYVQDILNSFGHNGSSCVHRLLCQLGSEPLHTDDDEDLLHEVASFILNPSNDKEEVPVKESLTYIQAHSTGQDGEDCSIAYDDCYLSIIDFFSQLH